VVSPFGRIASSWTRQKGRFTLRVEVPVGSTAEILAPVNAGQKVHAPAAAKGGARKGGHTRFTAGAGSHLFRVTGWSSAPCGPRGQPAARGRDPASTFLGGALRRTARG